MSVDIDCSPRASCYIGPDEDKNGFTYSWTIADFRQKMENYAPRQALETPIFNIGDTKWWLKTYPNGNKEGHEGTVYVYLMSKNSKKITAHFEVFTKNTVGTEHHAKKVTQDFEYSERGGGRGITFLKHSKILENEAKILKKGRLDLMVVINVKQNEIVDTIPTPRDEVTSEEMAENLKHDLKGMMEKKQFTDFKIICDGAETDCHKSILAARSDVFSAMFENDMLENETNQVVIKDLVKEVIHPMIEYIYTGNVKDITTDTAHLLKAADKYNLGGLKKLCEEALIKTLAVENCVDMIILADMYHAHDLKQMSKEMIVKNGAIVILQEGWKEKLKMFPYILCEIFEASATSPKS